MLHRVNPPNCENQFERILEFQRQLLELACSVSDAAELTRDRVRRHFGASGEWVCGKIWKRQTKEHRDFGKHLLALVAHVGGDASLRQQILAVFDHDTSFNRHLDDPGFSFQYSRVLGEPTRDALRPLMVDFYTDLLEAGFPTSVHNQPEVFSRTVFVKAFYAVNAGMNVCPACDGRRTDLHRADTDHFFPKADYPFLSVHARNLLPVCTDCNRKFKLGVDPIDDPEDEPLLNSFYPYDVPAIEHIDVNVSRPNAGEREIKLTDRAGMPSRRLQRFNQILNLEKRWLDRLDEFVEATVLDLRGLSRSVNRQNESLTEEELREQLRDELSQRLSDRNKLIGKTQGYVLHCSYLQLSVDDDDEFEELFMQFTQALNVRPAHGIDP